MVMWNYISSVLQLPRGGRRLAVCYFRSLAWHIQGRHSILSTNPCMAGHGIEQPLHSNILHPWVQLHAVEYSEVAVGTLESA